MLDPAGFKPGWLCCVVSPFDAGVGEIAWVRAEHWPLTIPLKRSSTTLVKFNWHAALGDMVLSRAEFETLSRLKTPLAQVRGHWVEVNAENLKRVALF